MATRKILFVDDNLGVLKTAELLLRKAGYDFRAATSPAEAYSLLAAEKVDAIFLDLNFSRAQMSGEEGLTCLREIRRADPDALVIVVTGHSGLTVAVQALRAGAHDFIMKPWNDDRLIDALEDGLRHPNKSRVKPVETGTEYDTGLIVGESDALTRVKDLVTRYAPLTANILILGENGSGKTLVAHALHRLSRRTMLKVVEAARLAPADLDDLEDATLLLENVDELDPGLNVHLTAWLQQAGRHNNRVVATTCRQHPSTGLQKSLLYALSTLEMMLPPLRERSHDIELLASHFARVFALRQGMVFAGFSPDAVAALRGNSWPDNLHALRRTVERAVVAASGAMVVAGDLDLPGMQSASDLGLNLEVTEKYVISEALSRHNFNISKAATELGVTRQTLYRRMGRHGL
ncbi:MULTISPECIES: sigma-54 dependent transcriptional regulator [Asticcacaulis]|uniref:sigma-54-dependent transcriptional regulator n=1 Tax=Asticcacaulis TaxID=76890 RepID=UPI001AE2230A|nr:MULTISPECIES: response regulator [Asticcacaulis]MBP2161204.1 DNA-binding NtrC family response regulator [Asticcacaulis solisilvae]MDR6802249.1 DNA-binding NtrC family response regulator [Asticcacaulis sp. BE141]